MGCIAYPLYGVAAIVTVVYATMEAHDRLGLTWLLAYLFAINTVAFAFYAYDKIFVKPLNFLHLRVPEKVLIWELAFLGGVLGAFIAMHVFRHKTGPYSRDFRLELLTSFAIQMTLLSGCCCYLALADRS